jgi:hypothetical protein
MRITVSLTLPSFLGVGLFLAKGLRVLVSDPGTGAEQRLSDHLRSIWPLLERSGLSPGASLSNYKFVGKSLAGQYESLDFVQEVNCVIHFHSQYLENTKNNRTHRNDQKLKARSLQNSTKALAQKSLLHLLLRDYPHLNLSRIAKKIQAAFLSDIRSTLLI